MRKRAAGMTVHDDARFLQWSGVRMFEIRRFTGIGGEWVEIRIRYSS